MDSPNVIALFPELPADATNEQALAWIERVRRVLGRWEELPAQQTQMMTPELVDQAIGELNEMERMVYREMNAMRQA